MKNTTRGNIPYIAGMTNLRTSFTEIPDTNENEPINMCIPGVSE
jgi:hypothetical protein